MKKRLVIAIIGCLVAIPAITVPLMFQRPTPTVVGGATTAGALSSLLVDADGTLHTTSSASSNSVNIAQWGGSAVALGQNTMANSIPVTVASDQTPVGQQVASNSAPVVPPLDFNSRCTGANAIEGGVTLTSSSGTSGMTFYDSTGTSFTLPGASTRIAIYSWQVANSGSGNPLVTMYDNSDAPKTMSGTIAPTISGSNVVIPSGSFTTTANRGVSIGISANSTSVVVTAQGCKIP